MNKIIALAAVLILSLLLLCSCGDTITDENGVEHNIFAHKFISFEEVKYKSPYSSNSIMYLVYDKDTKIVYVIQYGNYYSSMSPYYVIVNGEPTLAIYGVNYINAH